MMCYQVIGYYCVDQYVVVVECFVFIWVYQQVQYVLGVQDQLCLVVQDCGVGWCGVGCGGGNFVDVGGGGDVFVIGSGGFEFFMQ